MYRSKLHIWGVALQILAASLMTLGVVLEVPILFITGIVMQVIAAILLIRNYGKKNRTI